MTKAAFEIPAINNEFEVLAVRLGIADDNDLERGRIAALGKHDGVSRFEYYGEIYAVARMGLLPGAPAMQFNSAWYEIKNLAGPLTPTQNKEMSMSTLHPGTQEIADALTAHGVSVVDIEPHEADDPESSDRIWVKRYPEGGMCEGEYIFVGLTTYKDTDRVDLWVGHNSADLYGGHPTYWSCSLHTGDNMAIQALVQKHWPAGK